ncbi:MAG: ATP-dependent DNA ligase, partial [Planctomycetota bacterium]
MVYDLLEHDGTDQREQTTDGRRQRLEQFDFDPEVLKLSPRIAFDGWPQLAALRDESRERGVEGVMLKRAGAAYAAGRKKGDWWKWKVDPYTVDCVMVYAQRGSGRRSSLFTDYTFAVWDGTPGSSELVPVTKAYSGLTDEEFGKVDHFIKNHTLGKKGSFRAVEPELVFEIAFEGINESGRHKSGIALRFPRMHRWRTDKKPEEADTLSSLRSLLEVSLSR